MNLKFLNPGLFFRLGFFFGYSCCCGVPPVAGLQPLIRFGDSLDFRQRPKLGYFMLFPKVQPFLSIQIGEVTPTN